MVQFNPLDYKHLIGTRWVDEDGTYFYLDGIMLIKSDDYYWVMSEYDDERSTHWHGCALTLEGYGFTRVPAIDDEDQSQMHVILQEMLDLIQYGNLAEAVDRVTEIFNAQEDQINNLFLQCEKLKERLGGVNDPIDDFFEQVAEERQSEKDDRRKVSEAMDSHLASIKKESSALVVMGTVDNVNDARHIAEDLGFPVSIKARGWSAIANTDMELFTLASDMFYAGGIAEIEIHKEVNHNENIY